MCKQWCDANATKGFARWMGSLPRKEQRNDSSSRLRPRLQEVEIKIQTRTWNQKRLRWGFLGRDQGIEGGAEITRSRQPAGNPRSCEFAARNGGFVSLLFYFLCSELANCWAKMGLDGPIQTVIHLEKNTFDFWAPQPRPISHKINEIAPSNTTIWEVNNSLV
jgi:hypothetical protein